MASVPSKMPLQRLFEDYHTVEREYYLKTKIFPIMHVVVIRRDVYQKHHFSFEAGQRCGCAVNGRQREIVNARGAESQHAQCQTQQHRFDHDPQHSEAAAGGQSGETAFNNIRRGLLAGSRWRSYRARFTDLRYFENTHA